jgi:alpha-beta hydrolase superfamily lysophospholipase
VFGQSFGAMIVMDFAMRFDIPIAGLILSSTMLKVHSIESSSIKFFGEFFKDFVVNNLENPTALTKNCYNIKKHLDDRISIPFFGIRFLRELLFCSESVTKNASRY